MHTNSGRPLDRIPPPPLPQVTHTHAIAKDSQPQCLSHVTNTTSATPPSHVKEVWCVLPPFAPALTHPAQRSCDIKFIRKNSYKDTDTNHRTESHGCEHFSVLHLAELPLGGCSVARSHKALPTTFFFEPGLGGGHRLLHVLVLAARPELLGVVSPRAAEASPTQDLRAALLE